MAREAGHKAKRGAVVSHVLQHDGHIDAFASRQDVLIVSSVNLAGFEAFDPDDIIQGRVECHRVNHDGSTSADCLRKCRHINISVIFPVNLILYGP